MNQSLDVQWRKLAKKILNKGKQFAPRNQVTKELMHRTITVDASQPVLLEPGRKLSYQFMSAEAYWILSGSNLLKDIEPWNKHISKYSDDGIQFAGAYGPSIDEQLDYVIKTLERDPLTRQAGLTIWKRNPDESKDIPCTVSIFFYLRNSSLHCSVFMRSSDVWLGLPYDVFTFCMLMHLVCCRLNSAGTRTISPGLLSLTAGSSHIYEQHFDSMRNCIENPQYKIGLTVPTVLFMNEAILMEELKLLRDSKPGDKIRWWGLNSG